MMCEERKNLMELILLLLVLLLALGIAVVHWGADSTDKMNSPEWNRKEERGGIF